MDQAEARSRLIEMIRLRGAQIYDPDPKATIVNVHYRGTRGGLHLTDKLLSRFAIMSEANRAVLVDHILRRDPPGSGGVAH